MLSVSEAVEGVTACLICMYLNFSAFGMVFLPCIFNYFEPCVVQTMLGKTTDTRLLYSLE